MSDRPTRTWTRTRDSHSMTGFLTSLIRAGVGTGTCMGSGRRMWDWMKEGMVQWGGKRACRSDECEEWN
jgi:hypothetical protein